MSFDPKTYEETKLLPTVNVAAINELADFIESEEWGFDMTTASVCYTAGCVGGSAAKIWVDVSMDVTLLLMFGFSTIKLALRLGMPEEDAFKLCYQPESKDGMLIDLFDVNRNMAVAMLRRLGKTGDVFYSLEEA